METYICENVFVPLRGGPSHKSEMLSQLLFGEKYRLLERTGHWLKVETLFDNYHGWIDINHLQHSEDTEGIKGQVLKKSLTCYRSDGSRMVLEAGCEIYNHDLEAGSFTAGSNKYTTGKDFGISHITSTDSIADTSMKFMNSPYIWGGRVASGIDCSGFTQLVYKLHGVVIPRDSTMQAQAGTDPGFLEEAEPGDLVFFDDERGIISHVGMILSKGLVIHASGRVRIDIIDHQGIYKNEIKGYSHRLRIIRRIAFA